MHMQILIVVTDETKAESFSGTLVVFLRISMMFLPKQLEVKFSGGNNNCQLGLLLLCLMIYGTFRDISTYMYIQLVDLSMGVPNCKIFAIKRA